MQFAAIDAQSFGLAYAFKFRARPGYVYPCAQKGSHVWKYGFVERGQWYSQLTDILIAMKEQGIVRVYVEDAFLYPDKNRMNVRTFGTLCELRGEIKALILLAQLEFAKLPPSTWQAAMGITGTRDLRKGMAENAASHIAGRFFLENTLPKHREHVADAICMAEAAFCTQGFGEAKEVSLNVKSGFGSGGSKELSRRASSTEKTRTIGKT